MPRYTLDAMKTLQAFQNFTRGDNSPGVNTLRRLYVDVATYLFNSPESPIRDIAIDHLCTSWVTAEKTLLGAPQTASMGAA